MSKAITSTASFLVLLAFASATFVVGTSTAQDFRYLEVKVVDEKEQVMTELAVEIKMGELEFRIPTDEFGKISMNVPSDSQPVELCISKAGYELQKVRWSRGSEVPAEHAIKMQPGKPGQGWVFDNNGQPVEGAEVYAAQSDTKLTFVNGRNPTNSKSKPKQSAVTTDAKGKFTLPHYPPGSTIVCLSDVGWAQMLIAKEQGDQALQLQLTPWAHVEVVTRIRAEKPDSNVVGLYFIKAILKDQGNVEWNYRGVTNDQGVFDYDRVIPGTAMAYREVPFKLAPGQPSTPNRSHGQIVQIVEGGQSQLVLGSGGRTTSGILLLPVDYDGAAKWETAYVALTENNIVSLAMRTAFFEYGKMLSQSTVMDPRKRIPPSSQPNYLVRYLATVRPDGSFAIENVPPGSYELSAVVAGKPRHKHAKTDFLQLGSVPITIATKPQGDDASYDIGEHILDHAQR